MRDLLWVSQNNWGFLADSFIIKVCYDFIGLHGMPLAIDRGGIGAVRRFLKGSCYDDP